MEVAPNVADATSDDVSDGDDFNFMDFDEEDEFDSTVV